MPCRPLSIQSTEASRDGDDRVLNHGFDNDDYGNLYWSPLVLARLPPSRTAGRPKRAITISNHHLLSSAFASVAAVPLQKSPASLFVVDLPENRCLAANSGKLWSFFAEPESEVAVEVVFKVTGQCRNSGEIPKLPHPYERGNPTGASQFR